ncbi:MAG: SH3 domain-containing protein [Gemmatimonadaceae bacterium]
MPTLQEKYADLINAANSSGATNLAVRAQDNILYIDGEVPTGEAKDKLWNVYDKIDPDFRSGDLVLNLNVSPAAPSTQLKVTTESSNLNIRKGPGTDQPIIGKAAHNSEVTLLSKYNDEWALVRSAKGEEGYCSLKYLTAI